MSVTVLVTLSTVPPSAAPVSLTACPAVPPTVPPSLSVTPLTAPPSEGGSDGVATGAGCVSAPRFGSISGAGVLVPDPLPVACWVAPVAAPVAPPTAVLTGSLADLVAEDPPEVELEPPESLADAVEAESFEPDEPDPEEPEDPEPEPLNDGRSLAPVVLCCPAALPAAAPADERRDDAPVLVLLATVRWSDDVPPEALPEAVPCDDAVLAGDDSPPC